MPREHDFYRDALEDILTFFEGKRELTIADVKRYTKIGDYRTLHKRFPFNDKNRIAVTTLARHMTRWCRA